MSFVALDLLSFCPFVFTYQGLSLPTRGCLHLPAVAVIRHADGGAPLVARLRSKMDVGPAVAWLRCAGVAVRDAVRVRLAEGRWAEIALALDLKEGPRVEVPPVPKDALPLVTLALHAHIGAVRDHLGELLEVALKERPHIVATTAGAVEALALC